jgi:hypothetical protein
MLLPSKEREYAYGVVLDGTLQETVALGEEPPANPLTGKTPSLSVKKIAHSWKPSLRVVLAIEAPFSIFFSSVVLPRVQHHGKIFCPFL